MKAVVPARKSLEACGRSRRALCWAGRAGSEGGWGQASCPGEQSFTRRKLGPSSPFTGQRVFGQHRDRAKNTKAGVAGKHFLPRTCRMFLFLSFYGQMFNVCKRYIQKSTQIVSAQLDEVLQSKLTGVTRTQMKKQNIANVSFGTRTPPPAPWGHTYTHHPAIILNSCTRF